MSPRFALAAALVPLTLVGSCRATSEPPRDAAVAGARAAAAAAPAANPARHSSYPPLSRPAAPASAGTYEVPLTPEVAGGYDHDPSRSALPLRQGFTRLRLTESKADPRAVTLALEGPAERLELGAVDLAPLLPRVPRLARGDDALTRLSLIQQEFNRIESALSERGGHVVKLANNCLRAGLWEIILERATPMGRRKVFHAWFDLPADLYERAFVRSTGLPFAGFEPALRKYPELNGLAVPLEVLRRSKGERRALPVMVEGGDAPPVFDEQVRKRILIVNRPAPTTFASFAAAASQPILMAKFDEPGFYNVRDPMKFDLRFLTSPGPATWRKVSHPAVDAPFDELEIPLPQGRRLLIGHAGLSTLPARDGAPTVEDGTTLRLTFGIGTGEIYMQHEARSRAMVADAPEYLLLLGPKGENVDNHFGGLDRVYLWRERGSGRAGDRLHLWLVGYERIAIVAHYVLPFAPP